MRVITPAIFALFYWLVFFVSVLTPTQARYGFLYLIGGFVAAFLIHGRRHIRSHTFLWLNFLLYGMGSYAFMLSIPSVGLRNAFIVISGLIAASFISYILFQQHSTMKAAFFLPYRQPISFFYILSLWQMVVVVYFMRTFYNLPFSIVFLIIGIMTIVVSKGILEIKRLRKSSEFLVLFVALLAVIEVSYFMQLIPLHHVVLGTLLTLWYIVIIGVVDAGQEVSSRRRIFTQYLLLYAVALLLLLVTARWG